MSVVKVDFKAAVDKNFLKSIRNQILAVMPYVPTINKREDGSYYMSVPVIVRDDLKTVLAEAYPNKRIDVFSIPVLRGH